MDFYHSWIYRQVFNTQWFMWVVVYLVIGLNLLSPVFVWYALSGKHLLRRWRESRKQA